MVGVCNVQTGLLLTRTYKSHTILFDPLENSKPLILYILYIYDIYYLTFAILKKKNHFIQPMNLDFTLEKGTHF